MGPEDLLHDLAHAHQGLLVEALGQADDDLVPAEDRGDPAVDGPAVLGGDGDEDDLAEHGRLLQVVGEADRFGELEAGEKARVLPALAGLAKDLFLADPQADREADRAEIPRERGAPTAAADDRGVHVAFSPSFRSVPFSRRAMFDLCLTMTRALIPAVRAATTAGPPTTI